MTLFHCNAGAFQSVVVAAHSTRCRDLPSSAGSVPLVRRQVFLDLPRACCMLMAQDLGPPVAVLALAGFLDTQFQHDRIGPELQVRPALAMGSG